MGYDTYQVHELEALQKLAVLVFEAVGFINDYAAPLYGVQFRTAPQNHLKRGDNTLESVSTSQHTPLGEKKQKTITFKKWYFFIKTLLICLETITCK